MLWLLFYHYIFSILLFFLEIPPYLDFPCSVQRYIEVQNLFQGIRRDWSSLTDSWTWRKQWCSISENLDPENSQGTRNMFFMPGSFLLIFCPNSAIITEVLVGHCKIPIVFSWTLIISCNIKLGYYDHCNHFPMVSATKLPTSVLLTSCAFWNTNLIISYLKHFRDSSDPEFLSDLISHCIGPHLLTFSYIECPSSPRCCTCDFLCLEILSPFSSFG